jgi:protein TonB
VKFIAKNPTLSIAIGVSLLVHGALLAVRFVPPEALRFKPTDPGLEVVLVNARHDSKPVKAQALAQANLDGGGNANTGRAKSPLPDLRQNADGDSLKAARRRVAALEEQQKKLLTQARQNERRSPAPAELERPLETAPAPEGNDRVDSTRALARMEAEISRKIEDYSQQPKKTQITPSTRAVGYAMYYSSLQRRIENIGTLNFPQENGQKLYGELVVYIPIYHDGTLYEKEGGPRIERSSGNTALDKAALRIVRRSAPFGRFPANMRTAGSDDVWEVITRFKFTREDGLEAQLRGG